ncbi:sucrose-phosphate phosphatase [Neosynechococcus sphagnicola sy1]|uniref:sucrose-phosphate phosphatase n=1 Tax=Neosynechococcus sphagnicola sy1 TaxID=1497020 RepID=A0A098TK77_9CYAN|nr:sucrose-phosphate phosphatase [Neosynechococcus sphagnicola]KGF72740.1 sucrose-phosphate phosphatase [Neosynechococcus sphagnicola sy1]
MIALFVTDLDNTLVGDDLAMAELNQRLSQFRQTHGTKVVYITGRSPTLYYQLQADKQLLTPDTLVTAVGTEIYDNSRNIPDPTWSEKLSQGWERDQVVAIASHFAALFPQPASEQRPFKISYFLAQEAALEVLPQLRNKLSSKGLEVEIIYSGGQDLDILPSGADKGRAMLFLRQKWGVEPAQTVVCGDSGNDISLFRSGQEKGIIVGNAQPELLKWHHQNPALNRYLAKTCCARGILEGLKHFGYLE